MRLEGIFVSFLRILYSLRFVKLIVVMKAKIPTTP